MEFKPVKSKLNLIYTGSLLVILIIFISVLYFFITGAIKQQEIEQLNRFYEEEKHEFIEEIDEDRHERAEEDEEGRIKANYEKRERKNDEDSHEFGHVEYKPERDLFYYVLDNSGNLIKGEETVSGFSQYIYRKDLHYTIFEIYERSRMEGDTCAFNRLSPSR